MRRFGPILLTLLVALPLFLPISSKGQERSNWDETLDRYELLCERCLELSLQAGRGSEIPRESLSSLMTQLSLLKRDLNAAQGQMSAAQKARFEMIRRRFSESYVRNNPRVTDGNGRNSNVGNIIGSKREADLLEKNVRTSENSSAGQSTDRSVQMSQSPAFHREVPAYLTELTFGMSSLPEICESHFGPSLHYPDIMPVEGPKVPSEARMRFLMALNAGFLPDASFGLSMGMAWKSTAIFVKYMDSPLGLNAPSMTCLSDGGLPGGGKVWTDGTMRTAHSSVSLCAAHLVRLGSGWAPGVYAGAGYGRNSRDVKDISGQWLRVSDLSDSGLCIDAGLVGLSPHGCMLMLGLDVMGRDCVAVEFGLGLALPSTRK